MSDLVARIRGRLNDAPMPSEHLLDEAADTIERLERELAEASQTIVAFAGPWAVAYAKERGLPEGHLHAVHFDILKKAGARMDSFTRAAIKERTDNER